MANKTETPQASASEERNEPEQGCPVGMGDFGLHPCGRPIYHPVSGFQDQQPVCLMHSHDPQKDDAAFQAEFERILEDAGEGVADFRRFVFPGANYPGREFKALCLFIQATFTQDADFSGATFTQGADFSWARFTQDANFIRAKFTQRAVFRSATFAQDANFGSATFTQRADFRSATFTQDADFRWATFTQDADFRSATFARDADFIRATFTQDADFRWAKFHGAVEFRETVFSGDPDGPIFSLAHFEKPEAVTFYKTDLGRAIFHNCDVSKFVFSVVRWRQRPGSGKSMVFEEIVDLEDDAARALRTEPGDSHKRNYRLIAELYQQLKKNYDDRRDYWTAGDFHYGEMEMDRLAVPAPRAWALKAWQSLKRIATGEAFIWLVRFLLWLAHPGKWHFRRWLHQHLGLVAWYKYASDYGESYVKPALWLVPVLLLFTLLYPLVGLRYDLGRDAAKTSEPQVGTGNVTAVQLSYFEPCPLPSRLTCPCLNAASLTAHSAMTALYVAGFQKDLVYEPSYPFGRLLALAEVILTSTLIALFLLAVRRQFRR